MQSLLPTNIYNRKTFKTRLNYIILSQMYKIQNRKWQNFLFLFRLTHWQQLRF